MPDPTMTTIATAAIGKAVADKSSGIIIAKGGEIVRDLSDFLKAKKVKNENFISEYFEDKVSNISKIKTILDRSTPINLLKIYVPTKIKYRTPGGHEICDGRNVYQFVDSISNVIISALGGAGKSTFCKYLFIKLAEYKKYFPVFIEMRKLSQNNISIMDGLKSELKTSGLSEKAIADLLFNKVNSVIILDGWDEIPTDRRKQYFDEASKMMNEAKTARFVISSRPDDLFDSWSKVYKAHILPMEKSDSEELLNKLNFDGEVIARFKAQILEKKYTEFEHLLCNPLLLTIMVLTYSTSGNIPEKKYLFYQQAFDALFYKHDVCKDGLTRITETKLAEDDFKKITAAFSMISYVKELASFSRTEALSISKTAIEFSQIKANNGAFVEDLKTAVCMLQQDGLQYSFVHKSFQEYFAAYHLYVTRSAKKTAIDTIIRRAQFDQVLDFLYEMSPEYFTEHFLKYALNDFNKIMTETKRTKGWENRVFDRFIGRIETVVHGDSFSINMLDDEKHWIQGFCRWLVRKFGHEGTPIDTTNEEAIMLLQKRKKNHGGKSILKLSPLERKVFLCAKVDEHSIWYFTSLHDIYTRFTSSKNHHDLGVEDIL